jgi:hypothetical protein
MITNWYPNPKTIAKVFTKPAVQQQNQPWSAPSDFSKAQKLGLSVLEYRKRCDAVKEQFEIYKRNGFYTHMPVVPVKEEALKEHGQCTVAGVCWDYDLYGDVEWHEPPFILSIRNEQGGVINCTVNYVKATKDLTC